VDLSAHTATGVAGGIVNVANVTGGAGDDILVGNAGDNLLDGGAGNDILKGMAGADVLIGGSGDDILDGGANRDLLIGGKGHDQLTGGTGDDILVGGGTKYDANYEALAQFLAGWNNTSHTYAQRIDDLRNTGIVLGGQVQKFDAAAMQDDGASDTLTGGADMDWFWASTGGANKDTTDVLTKEKVN
jgi:Ca2+-binding RTX toxin-like protein